MYLNFIFRNLKAEKKIFENKLHFESKKSSKIKNQMNEKMFIFKLS
jgi:hypothetical protein